jgi:acetyltransferase-like isoleucine patch superfamily enzyme
MDIGQYEPTEPCGAHFINYEYGIKPDIAKGVGISGLIDCIDKVTIEKHAFSGHDVMILTGAHDYTKFGEERKTRGGGGPVHIKEGAWLASRCIILGGVTVGKHAVVCAGAVVTKDVPDYAMVGGVPAQVIKYIKH